MSHTKEQKETSGKIRISITIHERPKAANERTEIVHWEADTVAGKTGGARLVILTDRKTRFLLGEKIEKKLASLVKEKLIELFTSYST